MRDRMLGRLLAAAAMTLLLAACFRVNMDAEISPENTVSGTAVIAFDQALLELSGQSADQLLEDMDVSDLPEGATLEPYEEDGFVGQEITFEEVPLAEFQGQETAIGGGDALRIERRGDQFHVSGRMDLSGEEFTGGGQVPQELLDRFEFRISLTFPGEVTSATGDIDGNTVTWEPMFGENNRIEAVASAIPSSGSTLMTILLIVAAVVVLGIIAFLLMRRRTPAPATAPGGAVETWTGTSASPGAVAADEPTRPVPPAEATTPMPTSGTAPPAAAPTVPPDAPGSAVPEDEEQPPPVPPVSG